MNQDAEYHEAGAAGEQAANEVARVPVRAVPSPGLESRSYAAALTPEQ